MIRSDQNAELERIVRDLVIPAIVEGRKSATILGDGWKAWYGSAKLNANQGVLYVTFYGEWSSKHFRGFYPTAALRNLPFSAKHSKGNHMTEPNREKWEDVTTIFFKFAQVIAWANLQQARRERYEREGMDVKACRSLAHAHGVRYLFIDEDGNVPLRLIDPRDGCVAFATHKLGEGFVFLVNPHTGECKSVRDRLFDLEGVN